MNKVVNLDEHRPHLAGEALCMGCGHRWQAVAPVGAFKELECSECKRMMGTFTHYCIPGDEHLWTCNCGCMFFTVSFTRIMCVQCGISKFLSELPR